MTLVLSLTNLWRNRMRTALTVAGVAVVVAAYLSVSYYFSFFASRIPVKPVPLPADVLVTLRLPKSGVADFLADHPQVETWEAVAFANLGTPSGTAECLGIAPGSRFLPFGEFTAGRSPAEAGEIAVPSRLADIEGVGVGGKITLVSDGYGTPIRHDFTVVGIFAPEDPRYDVPVMLAEDLGTFGRVSVRYMLKLREGSDVERFASILSGDRDRVAAVETEKTLANAAASEDWARTWGAALSSAQMLDFVVLIIAGLGVLNTILVSVLERRREFGIMKACGMLEGQVFFLFAQEGLILAILGYALGVAVYFAGLFALRAAGRFETVAAAPAALITAAVEALVVCVIPSMIPGLEVAGRTARELLSAQ